MKAGCTTLIVFLVPSGCLCSMSLPRVPYVDLQNAIEAFSVHSLFFMSTEHFLFDMNIFKKDILAVFQW